MGATHSGCCSWSKVMYDLHSSSSGSAAPSFNMWSEDGIGGRNGAVIEYRSEEVGWSTSAQPGLRQPFCVDDHSASDEPPLPQSRPISSGCHSLFLRGRWA